MELQLREASEAEIPKLVEMKLAMFAEAGRSGLLRDGVSREITRECHSLYREMMLNLQP